MPIYGLSRYASQQPPQLPSGGGGGFFGIHLPSLGLGEMVHEIGGAALGLGRLAYDPLNIAADKIADAIGRNSSNTSQDIAQARSDYSNAGKGVLGSVLGTAADIGDVVTLGQAHKQLTDYTRNWVGQHLGPQFQPQPLMQKIKSRGLLPAITEDVGNVALAGDAASGLLKLGDVGTAANAEATAARAAEAGATARDLADAAKAAKKAGAIDAAGLDPEAVASRARTLEKLHPVAHPYSALFRGAIRPVLAAAQDENLARVAGDAAAVTPAEAAAAHLEANPPVEPVPAEPVPAMAGAPATPLEAAAAEAAAHEAAKPKAAPTLPAEPAPGMVRLYRGEQLGNVGGHQFTDDLASAQGHAGPEGQVLAVDVPQEVAQAGAEAARANGDVGVTLPHEIVTGAEPLGSDVLRPATEIPAETPPEAPTAPQAAPVLAAAPQPSATAQWAQGMADGQAAAPHVEPTPVRMGPIEIAARAQAQMHPADWAQTLVSKLPDSAVEFLSNREAGIERRLTTQVKRELTRFQEAARRNAESSPAVQASLDATKEVLRAAAEKGHEPISPQDLDKMVGSAIIKTLDTTSLIEKMGVPADVVSAVVGETLPIPHELRTPEVMDAVGRAAEQWRAVEDERLSVMAGGRKGMKGLEGIGSDTPLLTKGEQAAWKEIVSEVERAKQFLETAVPKERDRIAAAIAAGEGKVGQIGTEVERLRGRQADLRSNLLPLVGRDPALDGPAAVRAPINDAGNGPLPFDRRTVPQLGAGLQNIDELRDAKALPPETAAQSRTRGYQAGRIVERHAAIEQQIAERTARAAKLQSAVDEMKQTLLEHTTPSELQHAKMEGHVQRGIDRLAARMENPSVARVPGQWKPMWGAITELHKMAVDNPELASVLDGMPKTFSEVLRKVAEAGVTPSFVSSLSESEVRKLVYEQARLGATGREAVAIESGARKTRVGAFARERSISALAAAMHSATHEAISNAVIDFVEQTWRKPVVNDIIPKGWVPWDGERAFIRTGERVENGTKTATTGLKPQWMIPVEVKKALEDSSRDYSHSSFKVIQKIQRPWQALMLSLNPAFQVHHMVVKVLLAVKEGADIRDFVNAWHDYRAGMPKNAEAALQTSYFGDHAPSIVPRPPLADQWAQARAAGGAATARQAYETGLRALAKPLDVVDKLTRSAVYESVLRKGGTSEMALNRAFEALGDYESLSAFERQVVRAVMPFYPFQKTILKIMLKYPIENPKVVGIAAALSNMNREAAADAAGGPVPQGYEDLFRSPLGVLNLHSLDPFAKVEQLATPQGIVQSINPFLTIAIKNAYGVPNSDHLKRIDQYGHVVDDTSPAADLTKLLAGSPQAKLVEGAFGLQAPGQPQRAQGQPGPSGVQAAAQFAGLPIYNAADVQKIVDRQAKSTNTMAGGGGGGSRSSSKRSSGRRATHSHKARTARRRAPRALGTGSKRKGIKVNTQKVLGASHAHSRKAVKSAFSSSANVRGTSAVGVRFKSATSSRKVDTTGVRFNPSRRSH